MQLTPRQAAILKAVVEIRHATGRPVGSRALVEHAVVAASASTVRYELGRLEELGLLDHPHTSAGRVPTDLGYRVYVDHLMDADCAPTVPDAAALDAAFEDPATRIDEALRDTTRRLADATGLLAVVTAPRATGAIIRHVEVLQLQPRMMVVVAITATGDVARHVVPTADPVDPGLVEWARQYLDERIAGLAIGERRLHQRLEHPDLAPVERSMLALLAPVFDELDNAGQELHVGGAAGTLARHGDEVQRILQLVAMLDERRRLLEALRPVFEGGSVPSVRTVPRASVRIGVENQMPELQRLSVVGTSYGVGRRPLGMVGLIGPRAMDYAYATRVVRIAAESLSDLAGTRYDR